MSAQTSLPTSVPGRTARLASRPHVTAILTTLLWNVIPLLALAAWTVVVARTGAQGGEDWTGLIIIVVLAVVGTALVVGGGLGVAVTAILVRMRLRRAAAAGRPGITTRTAILLGSAGAGSGWLIGVGVAVLMPMALSAISTITS